MKQRRWQIEPMKRLILSVQMISRNILSTGQCQYYSHRVEDFSWDDSIPFLAPVRPATWSSFAILNDGWRTLFVCFYDEFIHSIDNCSQIIFNCHRLAWRQTVQRPSPWLWPSGAKAYNLFVNHLKVKQTGITDKVQDALPQSEEIWWNGKSRQLIIDL